MPGKSMRNVIGFWGNDRKLDASQVFQNEYRGWELNPHDRCQSQDFKSCASASFATPAYLVSIA